jgi:hypothetical protein
MFESEASACRCGVPGTWPFLLILDWLNNGVGQNRHFLFLKNGMEHCGYMVSGSENFLAPCENYEPNVQPTL